MSERIADRTRDELLSYIADRLLRIRNGAITGSHLHGVGQVASNKFEELFREATICLLYRYSVNYAEIQHHIGGKPFEKLTLGQLIDCVRQVERIVAERYKGGISKLSHRQSF